METIEVSVALANKEILSPQMFVVYVWLKHYCEENNGIWKVDFKELNYISDIPIKKLSLSIKNLELKGLINIVRKNNRVIVSICELPEQIDKKIKNRKDKINKLRKLKQKTKAIPVSVILQS